MSLKGWNFNLKPVEKKREPEFYGILPPKNKDSSSGTWDASANRWIGKKVPAQNVFPDTDWEDWMVISDYPQGSDISTESSVMDMAFVHKDYIIEIPACICKTKDLASLGCKCGCMAAEKMFKKLLKLAQK